MFVTDVLWYLGSEMAFRGYGLVCLIVLILYAAMNYFLARRGDLGPLAESGGVGGAPTEDLHLAPHGVPSGLGQSMNNDRFGEDGGASGTTGQYGTGHGEE